MLKLNLVKNLNVEVFFCKFLLRVISSFSEYLGSYFVREDKILVIFGYLIARFPEDDADIDPVEQNQILF